MTIKIAIVAAQNHEANAAAEKLRCLYDEVAPDQADVIVCVGGDGHLLKTLHQFEKPVFGMHCGTVGFLLNAFDEQNLFERLANVNKAILNALKITAITTKGETISVRAMNELSLLRSSPQAAKLKVIVDEKTRIEELVCDGILVATPAGSTAYNLSAHGPVIPLGSNVLALTPLAPFRPRRWRGALLPHTAKIEIQVLKKDRRPVMAAADEQDLGLVEKVLITEDTDFSFELLYDPELNLAERIIREQFDA